MLKRKTVFVIGSKPDVSYPNMSPDIVVGANGAVKRLNQFDKAYKIGIITNSLFNNQNYKIYQLIESVKVDELAIIQFKREKNLLIRSEDCKIVCEKRLMISRLYKAWIEIKSLNKKKNIKTFFKDYKPTDYLKEIYRIFIKRKVSFLRTSTGVFGVPFVLNKYKNGMDIYLIGIGLKAGTVHFHDKNHIYPEGHIIHDLRYLKCLQSNKNINIHIADSEAQQIYKRFLND